jgi:hypothetical protein
MSAKFETVGEVMSVADGWVTYYNALHNWTVMNSSCNNSIFNFFILIILLIKKNNEKQIKIK